MDARNVNNRISIISLVIEISKKSVTDWMENKRKSITLSVQYCKRARRSINGVRVDGERMLSERKKYGATAYRRESRKYPYDSITKNK